MGCSTTVDPTTPGGPSTRTVAEGRIFAPNFLASACARTTPYTPCRSATPTVSIPPATACDTTSSGVDAPSRKLNDVVAQSSTAAASGVPDFLTGGCGTGGSSGSTG